MRYGILHVNSGRERYQGTTNVTKQRVEAKAAKETNCQKQSAIHPRKKKFTPDWRSTSFYRLERPEEELKAKQSYAKRKSFVPDARMRPTSPNCYD